MDRMNAFLLAVSSNWWEPGTPNALDIGDLSALLGFLVATFGVLIGIMKWWVDSLKLIIREEIEKATEPIHPNANGGLSLADVARKANQLEISLEAVKDMQRENRMMLTKLVDKIIDIEEELESGD
jgi:hypothetical protein